jgi:hypothetical protein
MTIQKMYRYTNDELEKLLIQNDSTAAIGEQVGQMLRVLGDRLSGIEAALGVTHDELDEE